MDLFDHPFGRNAVAAIDVVTGEVRRLGSTERRTVKEFADDLAGRTGVEARAYLGVVMHAPRKEWPDPWTDEIAERWFHRAYDSPHTRDLKPRDDDEPDLDNWDRGLPGF